MNCRNYLPWILLVSIIPCSAAQPVQAAHSIPQGSLSVEIEDFFQFPVTRPASIPLGVRAPNWRLNFLREEPGGADRLFVNDLYGSIFTLDKATKNLTTYLDFPQEFGADFKNTGGFAAGQVTFAFHPEFPSNGKFYTAHSEFPTAVGDTPVVLPPFPTTGSNRQHNVLTEWTASDPTANVFSGTQREMLRIFAHSDGHPIGDLTFNPLAQSTDPDYGMLYVAIGDGVSALKNTQRLDTYLGTVLRIDPDPVGQPTISNNGRYSIPGDNPWASDGDPNTFGEIYAYGFRNVHRISWDTQTGDLFGMEIGQGEWEEINRIVAGRNYGWRDREGNTLVGGGALPPNDATLGYTYPVAQYNHHSDSFPSGTKFAVSSGFAYRGAGIPSLQGKFIFGDIANGNIFYSELDEMLAADDDDPSTVAQVYELQIVYNGQDRELIDIVSDALGTTTTRADLRLGINDAGELYIMTKQDGWIRRLVLQESPFSADFDSDFDVDGEDLTQWAADFGLNGNSDADDDDDSDGADFLAWQRQFGSDASSAASSAAVPEPSVIMLAVAGLLTSAIGHRRKRAFFDE